MVYYLFDNTGKNLDIYHYAHIYCHTHLKNILCYWSDNLRKISCNTMQQLKILESHQAEYQ